MVYQYKNTARPKKTAKKKRQRPGLIRWAILAAFIVLAAVFLAGDRSVVDLIQLHGQKAELKKQEQKLIEEKEALKEEIGKLNSDEKYIEKVAREKFNMQKKNETVYHIKKK